MADGGAAAEFTLRLKNEIRPGARGAVRDLGDVGKALRGAAGDARDTERAWQRTLKNRRALVPSPPRLDRGLSVEFQRRRIQRGAAEAFTRRQAQIQHAGGLSRLSEIEGTKVGAMGLGTGTMAGAGAVLAVGAAAMVAAAGVTYLGARFAAATASALDFGQRSKLAFGSLTGDASLGAATFEKVRRDAQGLGLDVHDTVDSYRDLLAAQFSIGESNDLIRAAADLKAIGADAERVKLALLAITQIKMKGKLQAEEMRQLVNTGVSAELIYKALGTRLGKTRDQLMKMQKGGKISADDAIEAFKTAIKEKTHEGALGDTAKMFANSKISGLIAQSRAMIDNAFITLGGRLEAPATRLAQLLFGAVNKIAESPAVGRFADKIVETFGGAVAYVEKNWPRIETAIVRGVEIIADATTGAIDATRGAVAWFIDHWDTVKYGLYAVAGAAALLAVGTVALLAPIYAVAGATAYLTVKLIEGSAELGRWMKLAGAAAMVIPGLQGIGMTLSAAGNLADRGGNLQTLEDQIRSESRARQAGNVAGAASVPGQAGPGGKTIGTLNIPVSVSALDLDDPEVAGQKLAGPVATALRRALEHA